jgi:hypothetical protein
MAGNTVFSSHVRGLCVSGADSSAQSALKLRPAGKRAAVQYWFIRRAGVIGSKKARAAMIMLALFDCF